MGGVAVARSLVHGGQYAVHDGDKTLTALNGNKIKDEREETLEGFCYVRVHLH